METTVLAAGPAQAVTLPVNAGEVSRYLRAGQDLVVETTSGDTIRVTGFYAPAEGGRGAPAALCGWRLYGRFG